MTKYVEELIRIIRSNLSKEELADRLSDYHDNDIAESLESLTEQERKKLYAALGMERMAEIFAYVDDAEPYLKELSLESVARLVSEMDSDDAVDMLEELDEEEKSKILAMLDEEAGEDVKLLLSYEDDEIGSLMTTNFIVIHKNLTVRQAMRELVKQAGENDNISTIYVTDRSGKFYGAIELQDLIIAREYTELDDLISMSWIMKRSVTVSKRSRIMRRIPFLFFWKITVLQVLSRRRISLRLSMTKWVMIMQSLPV